jgi:hypothetical protein
MDVEKERRRLDLYDETQEWIRDNPEAYARFEELALEKVARCEHFSVYALTEVVRWDASIRFKKKDFAIPNAYRRYIGLRLIEDHPEIGTYCSTKAEVRTPEALTGKLKREVVEDPAINDIFENFTPQTELPPSPVPIAEEFSDKEFEDLFK